MAYTLQDLQTAVQDDLKDPNFSTSRVTRYLNYGQLMIFNTHVFKFCERAVSGALTVGSYEYQQQSDHQSTIGGVLSDPTIPTRRFLLDKTTYLPHRQFFELYPDPSTETASIPNKWTEFGTNIYFNCPVDKAYMFSQRYYRTPTSMSLPTDVPTVPEPFRELLELYASFRAEGYRGNRDVATMIETQISNALESMVLRYSPAVAVAPAKMGTATTKTSRWY